MHREQRENTPQVATGSTPILRLISSSAEGADRIAAHAAPESGYELHFDKEYYKTTFSGGKVSCDEFDELLCFSPQQSRGVTHALLPGFAL